MIKNFLKNHLVLAVCLLIGCLLLPMTTFADEPTYDDINRVAERLTCPTCAGISLKDCPTVTCAQWKEQISELKAAGYSDQEVVDYFIVQHGQQVLQDPPFGGITLLLWVLPIVALIIGTGWLFYMMKQWHNPTLQTAPAADVPHRQNGHGKTDEYLSQVEQDVGGVQS